MEMERMERTEEVDKDKESNYRKWVTDRTLRGFIRCFLLGYGVKAGISIVKLMFKLLTRKVGGNKFLTNVLQVLIDPEVLRFGLFLGGSCASFNATYWLMRRYRGDKKDGINGLVAGLVAASAISLDSSDKAHDRRLTFALYASVRAAELVCNDLVQKGYFKHSIWEYSDTGLFSLACFEIMFAWFYHPETLPHSYTQWINAMSNMDPRVLQTLRHFHYGTLRYGQKSDFLRKYCLDHGWDPAQADLVTCQPVPVYIMAHPYVTPLGVIAGRWWDGFKQAVMLYAPVHTIPLLIFRFKNLLSAPLLWLARLAKTSFQSAAFLATFIGIIWGSIVVVRLITGSDTTFGPGIGALLCGLSILLEKKSRRKELAMYVLPRAVHSWWQTLTASKTITAINGGEVALFSLAGAVIMYYYEQNPSTIRPSILKLMQRYFGKI